MEPKKILFVCLGNICRSPAAEAIFKKIAEKKRLPVEVDSAGTSAWHEGEKADARMRMHARDRGYNITSISRKFKLSDFDNFDLIVAMDENNHYDLKKLATNPDHIAKICRMADFLFKSRYGEIPDPYYGGDEGFMLVIKLLEEGSENLIDFIRKDHRK